MKRLDQVYVLRDDRGTILAVSEERSLIEIYIQQFFNYFKEHETTIECIKDRYGVRSILDRYIDTAILQPYGKIVLTELEIKYYSIYFKSNYQDIKRMIASIALFNNCMDIPEEFSNRLNDVFKASFTLCKTYEDYLDNLKSEYIFDNIIGDPLLSLKHINAYNELIQKMEYDLFK